MNDDIFDELFSEPKPKKDPIDYRFAFLDPPKEEKLDPNKVTETINPTNKFFFNMVSLLSL